MARRRLLLFTALLAFCVVGLGAYVRLSDAGLGCPDWPGCYGHLSVPATADEHARAAAAFPGKPLEHGKAWKEMVHRYAAGTLGLLIFMLTVIAWRKRQARALTTTLAAVVVMQALLGMWTVTWLLKPVIVTAHLLGGMATLALLIALLTAPQKNPGVRHNPGIRWMAAIALMLLFGQIALGGWVSANYAALACADFPTCHGAWQPQADYASAFTLIRDLGRQADGAPLPLDALTAIHWTHRIGALVLTLAVSALAVLLAGQPRLRPWAWLVMLLLIIQLSLGILNVVHALPLPMAVAHNLGAAALAAALVALNQRLRA